MSKSSARIEKRTFAMVQFFNWEANILSVNLKILKKRIKVKILQFLPYGLYIGDIRHDKERIEYFLQGNDELC